MTKSFIQVLPSGHPTTLVNALASFKTERFVPTNGATTLVLGNRALAQFTVIYKNGRRLDPGSFT